MTLLVVKAGKVSDWTVTSTKCSQILVTDKGRNWEEVLLQKVYTQGSAGFLTESHGQDLDSCSYGQSF
jgi:hypothetical protein